MVDVAKIGLLQDLKSNEVKALIEVNLAVLEHQISLADKVKNERVALALRVGHTIMSAALHLNSEALYPLDLYRALRYRRGTCTNPSETKYLKSLECHLEQIVKRPNGE